MNVQNKKFTKLDVVSGKAYFLCQCGQSAKYPLCDGSHKNTSFGPEKYVSFLELRERGEESLPVRLGTLCDGRHKRILRKCASTLTLRCTWHWFLFGASAPIFSFLFRLSYMYP